MSNCAKDLVSDILFGGFARETLHIGFYSFEAEDGFALDSTFFSGMGMGMGESSGNIY